MFQINFLAFRRVSKGTHWLFNVHFAGSNFSSRNKLDKIFLTVKIGWILRETESGVTWDVSFVSVLLGARLKVSDLYCLTKRSFGLKHLFRNQPSASTAFGQNERLETENNHNGTTDSSRHDKRKPEAVSNRTRQTKNLGTLDGFSPDRKSKYQIHELGQLRRIIYEHIQMVHQPW